MSNKLYEPGDNSYFGVAPSSLEFNKVSCVGHNSPSVDNIPPSVMTSFSGYVEPDQHSAALSNLPGVGMG